MASGRLGQSGLLMLRESGQSGCWWSGRGRDDCGIVWLDGFGSGSGGSGGLAEEAESTGGLLLAIGLLAVVEMQRHFLLVEWRRSGEGGEEGSEGT